MTDTTRDAPLAIDAATFRTLGHALVDQIAKEGLEHEEYEEWVVKEVEKGVKLPGLYPMNEETKKRYEAERKKK